MVETKLLSIAEKGFLSIDHVRSRVRK